MRLIEAGGYIEARLKPPYISKRRYFFAAAAIHVSISATDGPPCAR